MLQVHEQALKIRGYVQVKITEQGEVVWEHEGPNLVTTVGMTLIAQRLKDAVSAAPSYVALGSSTTQPNVGQTALQGTEHTRVSGTVTVTSNKWNIAATIGPLGGSTVAIGEFGIFNAAVAGTMLARFIIPATNLSSTGVLTVNWFVYIGDQ